MPNYLVMIHRPPGYDGNAESAAMRDEITALNQEMVARGVRVFVGGLQPPETARAVRRSATGAVTVSDGPYLESKEFAGGFWVLSAADMDEALEWGRKAAIACKAGVEVRPFF